MKIDGRVVTVGQIDDIIAGLNFTSFRPKFVEIHNTSVPDILTYQSWVKRGSPTPEQWGLNLAAYYAGKGWRAGPHAFVLPDGRILLFTPFNQRGTHSPSWNDRAIGIETVGEFEREVFTGTPSQTTLVALTSALNWHLGLVAGPEVLGVSGIHFHKEDKKSTHSTCPGKNLQKPQFVFDVESYTAKVYGGQHVDVPPVVHTSDTSELPPEAMGPEGIAWVQKELNTYFALKGASGHVPLRIDNVAGDKTKKAASSFQRMNPPLNVDGIAGPETRKALYRINGS